MSSICEPFAGGAAVSLAAWGMRPAVSYRGGKRRYAAEILRLLRVPMFPNVILRDIGMFGWAWATWKRVGIAPLADAIRGWDCDGRELFDKLASAPVPDDEVERLAAFLALQDSSVNGRAVTVDGDKWKTAGYAELSKSAIEKGFKSRLSREPLIKRLCRVRPSFLSTMEAEQGCALRAPYADIVYCDPPYPGTSTAYAGELAVEDIVSLCLRMQSLGARVGLSCVSPPEALLAAGWSCHALRPSRSGPPRNKTTKASRQELLIISPG